MNDPASREPYTLHIYDISYFSGKMQAYLAYKGIPHRTHEITWELVDRVAPQTGLVEVPVVECADGLFMRDSTAMIEWFEQHYGAGSVLPDDPASALLLPPARRLRGRGALAAGPVFQVGIRQGCRALFAALYRGFPFIPADTGRGAATDCAGPPATRVPARRGNHAGEPSGRRAPLHRRTGGPRGHSPASPVPVRGPAEPRGLRLLRVHVPALRHRPHAVADHAQHGFRRVRVGRAHVERWAARLGGLAWDSGVDGLPDGIEPLLARAARRYLPSLHANARAVAGRSSHYTVTLDGKPYPGAQGGTVPGVAPQRDATATDATRATHRGRHPYGRRWPEPAALSGSSSMV